MCSQRLHSTGRTLLRLMQLGRKKKMTRGRHFRIKLQLMADISAVVTERKIGFTYGAYGLISLYAFSKYIMLYVFYLMYYHCQSMHYIVQFKLYRPSLQNILLAIIFAINATSTDLFWLWMIGIDCVCSAIVVAYSLIFFISIRQTNALNLFCGYLLTAYLACIIPINTLAVIGVFTGQFNLVTTFFHLNMTIFVYVGIFLIHLLGASFSSKIHKCAKVLLGYSVNLTSLSIHQRIKLVLYFEKFLTHKKYGLTYLNHSVISF
ncbi:hypothetical protein TYRP_014990 [Tyrophagus putrescentiae]|nr:hypothetical protein TYRP_014990 [Tyrophagus putrescentiae]